ARGNPTPGEGHLAVRGVEPGQAHLDGLVGAGSGVAAARIQGEGGLDLAEVEVPLAPALFPVAEAQRAVRDGDGTGPAVQDEGLELGVLGRGLVDVEVGGDEVLAGTVAPVLRR